MTTTKTTKLSPEQQLIRSKLRLRFNHLAGCPEVFTAILGSKPLDFKWVKIDVSMADWYMKTFKLKFIPEFLTVDRESGGIITAGQKINATE